MINLTDEQKSDLISGNPKSILLAFDDGSELTNENILMEQMSITQTICDDQNLTLGQIFSTEFKTRIFNDDTTSYAGKWFNLSLSVNDTETSIVLGRFVVESETLTDDKMYKDIVAYDALHDVLSSNYSDWHNELLYPMTVKDYRDRFFSHVGISQVTATLPNDNLSLEKTFIAESYSGSDCLKYISEITGCFGMINNEGRFRWITIKPETYSSNIYVIPDECRVQGNLKYEEFETKKISCVHIREVENDIGGSAGDVESGNTYYVTGNLLVSGRTTEELVSIAGNILSNINEIAYTPATVGCVGMPWLECGDMISVVTPRKTITLPIFTRTLTGISALRDSYQANGSNKFTQNVNSQRLAVNQLKRRFAIIKETVEEVSTSMGELSTTLNEDYMTKTDTQSYVGQTADSITQSVNRTITSTGNDLKEYADAQISINADGIRSDVAYAINGKDVLAGNRVFTSWDTNTNASVQKLSSGYYEISSPKTGNSVYAIHKCIDCSNAVGKLIFRCDVQDEAYFRLVVNSYSSVSWSSTVSDYNHITGTVLYETPVTTTTANKYVHIYIGTLADKVAHVKNPRLVFNAGNSDMATAVSSFIEQTASSISSKVSSETYNSKMTQLDNAIDARVTSSQMNTAITQKVNDTVGTIKLAVTNASSGSTASIVLKVGSKEQSTINLTGLVRITDLSNPNVTTTIKGGNISSSTITLGGSSNGMGSLRVIHSNGSTVIGSLDNSGLMLKSTSGWFTKLDASGNLLAGKDGNTYGRLDASTGHTVNGISGFTGMQLHSQIIRFNASAGISINGHLGLNAVVNVVHAIEKKEGGGIRWTSGSMTFRGGILCSASSGQYVGIPIA